jgi:hypothetical protein
VENKNTRLAPDVEEKLARSLTAESTQLLSYLPYLLQDPVVITKSVFGYSSIYGQWGWSLLARVFYPEPPRFLQPPYYVIGIHAYFALVAKWLMLGLIIAISFRMNRGDNKPPLFHQVGLIMAIFLTVTPGFGSQYLVWLVPFVLGLGLRITIIYYAITGLFLLMNYSCFENGFFYCNGLVQVIVKIGTWGGVIFVLGRYWQMYTEFKHVRRANKEEIV